MRLTTLAVGTSMPDWVNKGVEFYQQRLPNTFNYQLIEIEAAHRHKNGTPNHYKKLEAEKILGKINLHQFVIALAINGKAYNSTEISQQLTNWLNYENDICFIIGGPDGLHESCLKRANQIWSFSPMTFPHGLARILLLEQIYRAWSLVSNHPYHR